MPIDLALFGKRLREIRKDRELTQEQLATCLGAANGWISELENARQRHIESNTIYRLCEALQVSADYLMGLSNTPGPLISTARRRARKGLLTDDPHPATRAARRRAPPVVLGVLLLTLLLTGCATTWTQASKSQQEYYADFSACQAQAGQAASGVGGGWERSGTYGSAFRYCMLGKGWQPD